MPFKLICVSFCLLYCAFVHADTKRLPIEDFVHLPDVEMVEISPSGNKLAILKRVNHNNKRVLVIEITDLLTGDKTHPVVRHNNEFDVFEIIWASDRHILLKIDFFKRLFIENTGFNPKITERRLMVLDLKENTLKNIIPPKTFKRYEKKGWQPQFQDDIIDLLPDEPNFILHALDWNERQSPRVFKVNLTTLKRNGVESQKKDWRNWISDRQGNVRVGIYRKQHSNQGALEKNRTEYRIYVKAKIDGEWAELWRYNYGDASTITPLGFMNDPNILLVEALHNGRDAIFKVDLREPNKKTLYQSSEKSNIGGRLFYSNLSNDPVGYYTVSGVSFWDKDYKSFNRNIDKALPNTNNHIEAITKNETKYLVYSSSDVDSGSFYLGDKKNNSLNPIAYKYMNLDPSLLVKSVRHLVTARDGEKIEVFVTKPTENTHKASPTIIYANHGRGSAAVGGFDYRVQFLANRGYTVIQVNLRNGTGGYFKFAHGGIEHWGEHYHQDLDDVLAWSITDGQTDKNNVCLLGEKYAGYAALMSAAKNRNKYQCVVTLGAMTNIYSHIDDHKGFSSYENYKLHFTRSPTIARKYSPTTYAKDFSADTLLIYGEDDSSIRATQSIAMYKALKKAGKSTEYIEIQDEDSNLSSDESRLKVYTRIESFFNQHLH